MRNNNIIITIIIKKHAAISIAKSKLCTTKRVSTYNITPRLKVLISRIGNHKTTKPTDN